MILKSIKYFTAGIHVLIKKGDLYLVLRRRQDDLDDPNCWDLPGGGIDYGEQPFSALEREVAEETGLKIKVTSLLTTWGLSPRPERWSIELLAQAEYVSGEGKISPEHSDHKWLGREELLVLEPRSEHLKALVNIWR